MIRQSYPRPLPASRPGHTFKVADEIRLDGMAIIQTHGQLGDALFAKKMPKFMQKV